MGHPRPQYSSASASTAWLAVSPPIALRLMYGCATDLQHRPEGIAVDWPVDWASRASSLQPSPGPRSRLPTARKIRRPGVELLGLRPPGRGSHPCPAPFSTSSAAAWCRRSGRFFSERSFSCPRSSSFSPSYRRQANCAAANCRLPPRNGIRPSGTAATAARCPWWSRQSRFPS